MAEISRRNFLKRLTASACGAAIVRGFAPNSIAFAEGICASNRKVLVNIFLNGGPHGPSILVPRASSAYFEKHPNIGVTDSLILDASHGLNPNMPNLHNLFNRGKAIFMNGAGYPNHSRSHEDSTLLLGKGLFSSSGVTSGWAGRFAAAHCSPGEIFSLFSFRGNIEETQAPGLTSPMASSLSDYGYGNDGQGSANNNYLRRLIAQNRVNTGLNTNHHQALLNAWEIADASVSVIDQVDNNYSSTVTYPSGLGTVMKDVAKLILSPLVTTRHIFVNQGGYDTHAAQGTRLPPLLQNLDQALAAFWSDMEAAGRDNDVIVIFNGEFGRTYENAAQGTDHGTGFFMGMIGNGLRAGVASPAYTDAEFSGTSRWVPVKFDYREVLEQILIRHQNTDPGPVFPEAFNRIGLNLFS